MEDWMKELAAALRERLSIIADERSRREPSRHMTRLQAVSERINALQATLPTGADPRLRHYLDQGSYDKALEFLGRL